MTGFAEILQAAEEPGASSARDEGEPVQPNGPQPDV
jgi:hypothetical protein